MKKDYLKKLLSLESSINIIKVEKVKSKNSEELNIYISSSKKKVKCPKCSKYTDKIHDKLKPSKILYLDNSGIKTYLIITKRRFKCSICNKRITEDLNLTTSKSTISLKVKQKVLKDFMEADKTIKRIAIDNHISEDSVRQIFLDATSNFPAMISNLPEIISLDEKATYTNEGLYSLIINDPIRRVTLDILPNRTKEYLIKYFIQIENRKNVKVVITDLYEPYRQVVKRCFPNAILVADPFHVVKIIVKALDDIRLRKVKKYESNKKSNEYNMFKNRINKALLLKSFDETRYELKMKKEQERLYLEGRTNKEPRDKYLDYWYGNIKIKRNNKFIEITRISRLHEMLELDDELYKAYNLKEDFFRIINYVKIEDIKRELHKFIKECKESNITEMIKVAKTLNNWLEEIINSQKEEKYNNGFTEANNNKIDKIISASYGYKNFDFFRKRTLVILQKGYSGSPKNNKKEGQKSSSKK